MTLPKKKSRKIVVNNREYRWMVGKPFQQDGVFYNNIVVEATDGSIHKFEECLGFKNEENLWTHPITPRTVSERIMDNLSDLGE